MEKEKKLRKKYSPKFKLSVILDLVQNHLNYREAIRRHWSTSSKRDEDSYRPTVREWHRIYLEKGADGFMAQSKSKTSKPMPASTEVNDLVAEIERLKKQVKRLQMENDILKKARALIQSRENHQGKKPR